MKLKNTLQVRCAPEAARAIATIAIIFMIDFSAKHFFSVYQEAARKSKCLAAFPENIELPVNFKSNP